MRDRDLVAVARALHIALGYESREVRIGKLKDSPFLDVKALVHQLETRGLLTAISASESVGVPYHSRE